jgi:hypothetical protein
MRNKKRVSIAFAGEDRYYRDLLKGHSLNTKSPIEYTDLCMKEPWESNWKQKGPTRIKGCHGVIAMLSHNSQRATDPMWEIACAKQERIPLTGVYIYASDDESSPPEMNDVKKVLWT